MMDIKKMSLSYAKCPAGDLHTGEILSLVCVDAKCTKRGLICPICRMMKHEDHEVLPLKIFIDEVKKSFLQSQDTENLNNLSDYLHSLDESKKQLLNILRDTAQSIAKQIKKLEQKIQENYLSIRKNILAQSTMSTKLPLFIESLVKKQENDAYWLQEEFQKYSELIKFDKSTIHISDKAKKIVEDYADVPKQVSAMLKEQIDKIKAGFKDLFSEKAPKPVKKLEGFTFSLEHKHFDLKVSDDKKELYNLENAEEYGIGYVKDESDSLNKKITLKILQHNSGNIVLGMGLPNKDKELAYLYSSPIKNQHFCLNSDGYIESYQNQDQSQQMSNQDEQGLKFNQVGCQVTITLNYDKNYVMFTKANSPETKILYPELSDQERKQLCFFVSLGASDRVRIVDQEG